MCVLVTGAAGFIGFHVSRRLLADGVKVIGLDNLNDYYDVSLKKARLARALDYSAYTDICVDIKERDEMSEIFRRHQPERVVNLAAQAGVRYSLENPLAA